MPCSRIFVLLAAVLVASCMSVHGTYQCGTHVPSSAWATLQQGLSGGGALFLPGTAGYTAGSKQYLDFTRMPLAVVACATDKDVVTAVKFALAQGICVSVKSSGHSYEGASVMDNRLALDLTRLNGTSWDSTRHVLSAKPGTPLIDFVKAAQRVDMYCTWGGCPSVAMGGYLTGGGEGLSQTVSGMGIDSVVGYTVVSAAGELVRADANTNPDLFWALRGGGGPGPNFGIVVETDVELRPNPGVITTATVSVNGTHSAEFSKLYMRLAPKWGKELGIGLTLTAGSGAAAATGWYFGTEQQAKAALAPLLAIPGATGMFESGDVFNRSFAYFDEWEPRSTPHAMWKGHSGHTNALSDAVVDKLIALLTSVPAECQNFLSGVFLFKQGGEIDTVPINATAFAGRNVLGDVEIIFATTNVSHAEVIAQCADSTYELLRPFLQPSIYPNLVDFTLKDPLPLYYGPNLPRLRTIRQRWDPQQFYNFEQAITF